jgi:N-acetylneuraminic acid mutarotase
MPTARSGSAAAAVAGRVFVVGGEASSQSFNRVEAYDPKGERWHDYAAMPTARHGLAAAEVGGKLYVIGGGLNSSKPASSANEIFEP